MNDEILDDNLHSVDFDNATITKINLLKIDVQEYQKHIRNAGIMLIFMGLFALVQLVYLFYSIDDSFVDIDIMMPAFVRLAVVILLYFACTVGLRYRPIPALIIATIIFTLPILSMLWTLMTGLYRIDGNIFLVILIRLIPYYFLIRGLGAAFKRRRDLEKLRDLGISLEEIKLAERLKAMPRTT